MDGHGHGCISDASLRCLIHSPRDNSKRADLQISETSPGRLIEDVSSETSPILFRFSQRPIWVASETVILGVQTNAFFGNLFIYLRVFLFFAKLNWYRKLLRAWFKLEIYLQYLYKRITFSDQIGRLHFPYVGSIISKILSSSYICTTQFWETFQKDHIAPFPLTMTTWRKGSI